MHASFGICYTKDSELNSNVRARARAQIHVLGLRKLSYNETVHIADGFIVRQFSQCGIVFVVVVVIVIIDVIVIMGVFSLIRFRSRSLCLYLSL